MTATLYGAKAASPGRMRPLNILHDLPAVADLIELCFSKSLDPEGRTYIDQMRRSGQDANFLNWAPRVIESVSLPLSGFVWEYEGRIVGNVSLIPFSRRGGKVFLIANVATHPDLRRQGIARQLTSAAMARAREKRAHSIWLHVRDDNPGAIRLYAELGFVERSLRTTWHNSRDPLPSDDRLEGVLITPRPARDWPSQSAWLSRAYPPDLDWYYSLHWNTFEPGFTRAVYRLMVDIRAHQWSAYQNGSLAAVMGSQRANGRADHLWLALPEQADPQIVTRLILHGRRTKPSTRGLVFEYPAGPLDEAFRAAGLVAQRTLSWMEAPGSATFRA